MMESAKRDLSEQVKNTQEYFEYVKKVKEQAFIRLVEIRKIKQELEKEEEQIRDWALDYVRENLLKDEKSADFEVKGIRVNVSIGYRKVFDYPDDIKKAEEELRKKKKTAELDGSAKLIGLNPYLVFKF